MYSPGTIKLVWFENYNLLKSQMFDSLEQALAQAKALKLGNDFMINKLLLNDNNYYEWTVLPEGKYTTYKYGMIITNNPLLLAIAIFIFGYGAFCLTKNIIKLKS